ncbi:hypothetical protein C8Q77DRAFT_1086639 [Trametes polyzona]|nr:hypothetical protein C8Q77DRAFT_1086639 [Trametes polyzona]
MPRLQVSRRTPLLSTNLRNAFLEAFNRNVAVGSSRALNDIYEADAEATRSVSTIARRVQADLRRTTGRYFPISQVLASIHALKDDTDHTRARSSGSGSNAPTPKPFQILITPTSPQPTSNALDTPLSMSRRRLACNIPALQSRLIIPKPSLSFLSPSCGSPSSPLGIRPLFSFSRRSSVSSGDSARTPVTPLEQIVHTPLSPPRMPRAPPPAPRTWARYNPQMRDDISPLVSPSLPYTPYILSPSTSGKPVLSPLRIPAPCPVVIGDAELRDNHLSSSPRSMSPFELIPSPLGDGAAAAPVIPRRPGPSRNNSTSNLSRTALLRASRPHLVRSSSASSSHQSVDACGALSSHLFQDLPSPVALASPFIIRSEEIDTEYFRF